MRPKLKYFLTGFRQIACDEDEDETLRESEGEKHASMKINKLEGIRKYPKEVTFSDDKAVARE